MLKCLDPTQRWIWQHPEDPDVRFEYKALTGPTLGLGSVEGVFRHYLDNCVTAAWNVNINGVDYAEWRGTPLVRWSEVLPADVANGLTLAILDHSRLSEAERGESSAPHGPQATESGNADSPNAGRGAAKTRAKSVRTHGPKS